MSQATFSYKADALEKEVGFTIFNRSNKGVSLTPAGKKFCHELRDIWGRLDAAIAQGCNTAGKNDVLTISMPMRSCFVLLPRVVEEFRRRMPEVALNVDVCYDGRSRIASFLDGRTDVLFALGTQIADAPGVVVEHLFDSRFYAVLRPDDPLVMKRLVTAQDLAGRTLLTHEEIVARPCSSDLGRVLDGIIKSTDVKTMLCPDHEVGLVNVASGIATLVTMGYTNDRSSDFVWVPFDTDIVAPCSLAHRGDDTRRSVRLFIDIACHAYATADSSLKL